MIHLTENEVKIRDHYKGDLALHLYFLFQQIHSYRYKRKSTPSGFRVNLKSSNYYPILSLIGVIDSRLVRQLSIDIQPIFDLQKVKVLLKPNPGHYRESTVPLAAVSDTCLYVPLASVCGLSDAMRRCDCLHENNKFVHLHDLA